MDCLSCSNKYCKSKGADCSSLHDSSVDIYKSLENKNIYENADNLVADGKAGSLSRLNEIIEFCRSQNYKKVSIAYCFSMEKEAFSLKKILESNYIKTESVRCTVNGVRENEILGNDKNNVNCNPAGQALSINKGLSDFVIEMGLCLGHDVIFHEYLKKPFTVFAVKDRVYKHNPLEALYDSVNY